MMFLTRPIPLHREQLRTASIGNTLLLKLCGFIHDQNARLVAVDEHHVEMHIGRPSPWLAWIDRSPRFRLRLDINEAESDAAIGSAHREARVEVTLDSLNPPSIETTSAAWKLLWRLRSHLMASP